MTKRLQTLREFFGNYSSRLQPEARGHILEIFKECRKKLEKLAIDPERIELNLVEMDDLMKIMNRAFESNFTPHFPQKDPYRTEEINAFVESLAQEIIRLIVNNRRGVRNILRVADSCLIDSIYWFFGW